MDMEMKQVKKSDFLLQPRHKEWLYTSVYDKALNVYISFVFIRIPLADQLTFIVFDPQEREPFVFRKMMALGKENKNVSYSGSAEEGWEFRLKRGRGLGTAEVQTFSALLHGSIPHEEEQILAAAVFPE